jgi:hypothetical protein
MENKEGVKNAQKPIVGGFGPSAPLMPTMAPPTPPAPSGQFTGMTKREIYEWNKRQINATAAPGVQKAMLLQQLEDEYGPQVAEEERKNSTQGYSTATRPEPQPPKVPTTGTVPAKTGNKVVDAAVKKFDTQGTDVKKLESFWDRAAKFFTGGKDVDVSIWDFLEATGRAMAKSDAPTTRQTRLATQREDALIKADLEAKKAEKEGTFANQLALQKMADQSALDRAKLMMTPKVEVTPLSLGASQFPGGQ